MSQLLVPATNQRGNYLRVIQTLAGKFGTSEQDIINTYKIYNQALKLPQQLQTSLSTYKFNPVKAVDTPVPGELKIDRNDFFAVTGVGIRFTRATYTSSTGAVGNFGNYPEYTYPYSAVFSGANEALALQCIVRGTLSLSVTDDLQWNIPCSELVYKNEYINAQEQTIVQGNMTQNGIYDLDSIVVLDGNADNSLTLQLLAGSFTNIDGATALLTKNYVMPVLYGFQIKNLAGGGFSAANCRI